jgi:hypothetical protein
MQVPNTPAIWADFVHIRTVKGRKVCEIILETALEDLIEVLNRLGNPVGADSVPVAITRVDPNKVKAALDIKPQAKAKPEAAPHKPFSSLPLSQQAAIRCGDVLFQEYLKLETEDEAADYVRHHCGVKSRSDIKADGPSAQRWKQIEAMYQSWLTDRKFAEAKR